MYHYRLVVSYKGTNYFGWQDLGTSEQKPTIAASLDKVLQKICKYQKCTISSASRTDAGVHASGQVVKISIPLQIESTKLLLGMNSLLPEDIRILDCEPSTLKFNANKDSRSKEYHYYFCTEGIPNPILNDIMEYIPSPNQNLHRGVDIELMKQACELFIGEHDFYSFAKRDTSMLSTLRRVISCEILQFESFPVGTKSYYLKIVGEGFLRYMVRYIMGALFALGRNQLRLCDISEALLTRKEEKISSKVKAKGLHLIEISY